MAGFKLLAARAISSAISLRRATQAAFANARPSSWQPDRERIESFDEHPHRHFPDGSVIRRTDLFHFPALGAGLGKGEAREITPAR